MLRAPDHQAIRAAVHLSIYHIARAAHSTAASSLIAARSCDGRERRGKTRQSRGRRRKAASFDAMSGFLLGGRRRGALCSLLGHLLPAGDGGLDADAAKDEGDAEPLHAGEAVTKGDDGQDHGKHLARDGDGDEEDRGEGGKGIDCGQACPASVQRG